MWQHVKLSEQIRPWDTQACCWDVKQPTTSQPANQPTNQPVNKPKGTLNRRGVLKVHVCCYWRLWWLVGIIVQRKSDRSWRCGEQRFKVGGWQNYALTESGGKKEKEIKKEKDKKIIPSLITASMIKLPSKWTKDRKTAAHGFSRAGKASIGFNFTALCFADL